MRSWRDTCRLSTWDFYLIAIAAVQLVQASQRTSFHWGMIASVLKARDHYEVCGVSCTETRPLPRAMELSIISPKVIRQSVQERLSVLCCDPTEEAQKATSKLLGAFNVLKGPGRAKYDSEFMKAAAEELGWANGEHMYISISILCIHCMTPASPGAYHPRSIP